MQSADAATHARVAGEQPSPDAYTELLAIAREHGAEEIKHLTRAYQAIAPRGGGRIIDLTALVDAVPAGQEHAG